jgi:hypothetical protein
MRTKNFPAKVLRRRLRAMSILKRSLRQDEIEHGEEHAAMLISARAQRTKIRRTAKTK